MNVEILSRVSPKELFRSPALLSFRRSLRMPSMVAVSAASCSFPRNCTWASSDVVHEAIDLQEKHGEQQKSNF